MMPAKRALIAELNAPESPPVVRNWIANSPDWLQIEIVSCQVLPKYDTSSRVEKNTG